MVCGFKKAQPSDLTNTHFKCAAVLPQGFLRADLEAKAHNCTVQLCLLARQTPALRPDEVHCIAILSATVTVTEAHAEAAVASGTIVANV